MNFSWLETTCHTALSSVIELFHQFFYICGEPLLHDVTNVCTTFICLSNSIDASQIGQRCLERLIQAIGPKLSSKQWNIIINDIIVAMKRSYPKQLKSKRLQRFFNIEHSRNDENQHNDEVATV